MQYLKLPWLPTFTFGVLFENKKKNEKFIT